MQDIFVDYRRAKSKKEVKMIALEDPSRVSLEATSVFGNEYDGPIMDAPDGTYTFVGPDPYTKRVFYGTIVKTGDRVKIT